MLLAANLDALREAAATIGVLAGALVALGAVAKLPLVNRPGRWLWHHIVADPLTAWVDGILYQHTRPLYDRIAVVEHEVRTNDGSSLRDVADRSESAARQIAEHLGLDLDLPPQRPGPPEADP